MGLGLSQTLEKKTKTNQKHNIIDLLGSTLMARPWSYGLLGRGDSKFRKPAILPGLSGTSCCRSAKNAKSIKQLDSTKYPFTNKQEAFLSLEMLDFQLIFCWNLANIF